MISIRLPRLVHFVLTAPDDPDSEDDAEARPPPGSAPECAPCMGVAHLNVSTTVCWPKFASKLRKEYRDNLIYRPNRDRLFVRVQTYSVLMCTSGGLAVAFCTTRNSLVTISMT